MAWTVNAPKGAGCRKHGEAQQRQVAFWNKGGPASGLARLSPSLLDLAVEDLAAHLLLLRVDLIRLWEKGEGVAR